VKKVNVYITAGTYNFLKSIEAKYPKETMVLMVNQNGAVLLHETNGQSVFKQPRKYETIDYTGEWQPTGFVAMDNITVTDEGRPLFEHQLKNQIGRIENESGFIAIRALRPLASNMYVILTVWNNEVSYQRWNNSNPFSFTETLEKGADKGVNPLPQFFTSANYVSKYTIMDQENN
jgi:heme oxygenase (mycobilin-producing)